MLLHLNDIIQPPRSIFSNRVIVLILNNFRKLIRLLQIHYQTGLIEKLNKKLEKKYIIIVGIISIIENEFDEIEASDLLMEVRKSIKEIRESYDLMDSVAFFNFTQLKTISNKILDAMYDLEFILRKKALKNKRVVEPSKEAEVTARLQIQSLESFQ